MKQETLLNIKKELLKLSNIYKKLVENWNGELEHGNNATYPITIIVEVLLHNMAFDSSVEKLYSNLKMLKELNDYNNKCYTTHFAYIKCSTIIDSNVMSEFVLS